jgi:hypothetical protein
MVRLVQLELLVLAQVVRLALLVLAVHLVFTDRISAMLIKLLPLLILNMQ